MPERGLFWRALAALVVAPSFTNNLVQTNIQNNYNNPYYNNRRGDNNNNRGDNNYDRDGQRGCPPPLMPRCLPLHALALKT